MIFPELQAGMRIGRDSEEQKKPYVLEKPLGDGGQAQVWRAKKYGDRGFYTEVALKLLDPSPAPGYSPEKMEMLFFSEAMVTSRLQNSEHFVKVHDAFRDPTRNLFGIEMEILHGLDLDRLPALYEASALQLVPIHIPTTLRKKPSHKAALPWPVVFSLFSQVFQGLAYAHTAKDSDGKPFNLIHRDIKPQNIMLCHNGHTKIIDLGIARWDQRDEAILTRDAATKGTIGYVAPEVILANDGKSTPSEQASPQSDLFSVGVVLYELLTSYPPFSKAHIWEYLMDIGQLDTRPPIHPCEIVPSLPRDAGMLVLQLLKKNPSERPVSASETLSMINHILRHHKAYMSSEDLKHWFAQVRGEAVEAPPRTAHYDAAMIRDAQSIAQSIAQSTANAQSTASPVSYPPTPALSHPASAAIEAAHQSDHSLSSAVFAEHDAIEAAHQADHSLAPVYPAPSSAAAAIEAAHQAGHSLASAPLRSPTSASPTPTQEAGYYAQTVLRIPSPLLDAQTTDILVQERHLLANDDASDDEAPLLSHPDLKPYAPQKPNTAHDPRIRTFSQPQYPDDTVPSSQDALDAFSLRPPTGILVGADGREQLLQAIEEANNRMPTQQDIRIPQSPLPTFADDTPSSLPSSSLQRHSLSNASNTNASNASNTNASKTAVSSPSAHPIADHNTSRSISSTVALSEPSLQASSASIHAPSSVSSENTDATTSTNALPAFVWVSGIVVALMGVVLGWFVVQRILHNNANLPDTSGLHAAVVPQPFRNAPNALSHRHSPQLTHNNTAKTAHSPHLPAQPEVRNTPSAEPPSQRTDVSPPSQRAHTHAPSIRRPFKRRKRLQRRPLHNVPQRIAPIPAPVRDTLPTPRTTPEPRIAPIPPVAARSEQTYPLHIESSIPCRLQSSAQKYGLSKTFVLQMPVGKHTFLCTNPKQRLLWRFQTHVTQSPNAVKRTFQKGTLFVRSKPWSSIHLEPFGEIGKTQSFLELPEGEYTLTLHKEGQSQHRKRLRVRILPKQLTRPLVIFW